MNKPSSETGNRPIVYRCSRCATTYKKNQLIAVRVQFIELGVKGKLIRSRTTEWLCNPCMLNDPIYNRESYFASPGNRDLAHARTIRERFSTRSANDDSQEERADNQES